METELGFVALFGVATVVALAARWLKVPYTVALVVAGLVLGSTGAIESVHLTKNLLYAVFLPGLIFEASFHLDFDKFWHNKWTILALAVPGVAASTALAAVLVTPVIHGGGATGFHFEHGLVFAALISATDPIAVVGLFKTMGAPKRLGVLIEGESLLNDGTAVVFFTLALALVGGGELSAGSAAVDFVRVVGVGLLIGAALGYLASKVIQQIDDPMLEITLTTIAAYGSFMAAEHFHFSGVIATVAAGMLCGNYGARTGMSPSTKIAVESFWEYVAFALNSIVFLLVGIEVHVDALVAAWQPIVLAWLVITLARAVVILVVSTVLRGSREKLPWSWTAVMTWGGLRGALSMVLVLGLPETFPHHDTVVNVTFGVVLLSILVQGITMAPLLRRLGVVSAREQRVRYEVQRARLAAVTAALATLRRMEAEGGARRGVLERLRAEYEERRLGAEAALHAIEAETEDIGREEELLARRRLLAAERDAVAEALRRGLVGGDAHDEVVEGIDAAVVGLETGYQAERGAAPAAPGAAPAAPEAAAPAVPETAAPAEAGEVTAAGPDSGTSPPGDSPGTAEP